MVVQYFIFTLPPPCLLFSVFAFVKLNCRESVSNLILYYIKAVAVAFFLYLLIINYVKIFQSNVPILTS